MATVAKVSPTFTEELSRAFAPGQRGPGLWAWRPLLLDAYLNDPALGADRVVFIDAGTHLNATPASERRLRDYERRAGEHGVVLMDMPHLPEREWTKPSVIEYFGLDEAQQRSGQIMGGVLVLSNDERARQLLAAWLESVRWRQGDLLLDPDQSEPMGPLIAHRHDQSILSCLAKSLAIPTIRDETYFGPHWGSEASTYPIWTVRNRTGASFSSSPLRYRVAKANDRLAAWVRQGTSPWE